MSPYLNMTQPTDLKKILSTFDSIRQELSNSPQSPSSSKEIQSKLAIREIQLKTVLEISEKLINEFISKLSSRLVPSPQPDINPSSNQAADLIQKYQNLLSLYQASEEELRHYKEEVLSCRAENERLSKSVGNNNLFSVEVYESEIQDLKKEFKEKIEEMKSNGKLEKIEKLEENNSHKKFIEIHNKLAIAKEQASHYKRKNEDLEDAVRKYHEHKKQTEKKYLELMNTHKKMFGYIEKLEVKVKKFQDKNYKTHNFTSDSISRENSLSFYSRVTDESRSFCLAIAGPVEVFSV